MIEARAPIGAGTGASIVGRGITKVFGTGADTHHALGPIDLGKLNVKGGSIAMGHPFAATGARVIATMAKLLQQKGSGRGLVSVCTAGGMGVTAILEAA